jgi:hypothetical protein
LIWYGPHREGKIKGNTDIDTQTLRWLVFIISNDGGTQKNRQHEKLISLLAKIMGDIQT